LNKKHEICEIEKRKRNPMVRLINECACGACDGGEKAPEGTYGGSYCPCLCHSKKTNKEEFSIAEYWRIIRKLEKKRNLLDRAIKALVDLGPDGFGDLIPPESLVKKLEKMEGS
jgi:hypothetical protein